MFTRLVKMEFEEKNIERFLENFNQVKEQIRQFPGCTFLELYQDKTNPAVFFTYSRWQNQSDLENYRTSKLFQEVWTFTKKLFADKPQAWSVDTLYSL